MECNFHAGQKVVFVPVPEPTEYQLLVKKTWLDHGFIIPVEGVIYTVRSIGMGMNHIDGEVPVIFLNEIRNKKVPLFGRAGLGEPGFSPINFRPVIERKTDISVFKAMLNPSKSQVSA